MHFDWVTAKLVLISPNQIAQIWEISFYEIHYLTDDSALKLHGILHKYRHLQF